MVTQGLDENGRRDLERKVSYRGGSSALGRDAQFVQEISERGRVKGLSGALPREQPARSGVVFRIHMGRFAT